MILALVVAGISPSAFAQAKESVLYSFQGGADGAGPVGSIVMDKAGNIFGATSYTNPCITSLQCGSVYELSPPQQPGDPWIETTLYDFQGFSHGDGGSPEGGLVQGADGNLYGTTAYGGHGPCLVLGSAVGCGTVYELVRPQKPGGAWKEKVLYSFQGNQDGQFPIGDLVFHKRGNLYGATWFGGGQGTTCDPLYPYCGTVFELTPPRTTGKNVWTETVLHSFAGVDAGDGGQPNGGLVFGADGALYGTAYLGGIDCTHDSGQGCGVLFRLAPSPNGETGGRNLFCIVFRACQTAVARMGILCWTGLEIFTERQFAEEIAAIRQVQYLNSLPIPTAPTLRTSCTAFTRGTTGDFPGQESVFAAKTYAAQQRLEANTGAERYSKYRGRTARFNRCTSSKHLQMVSFPRTI